MSTEKKSRWTADAASRSSRGAATSETSHATRSQAPILVAEDDSEMRTVLCEALEAEGYRVVAVEDGEMLARHLKTGCQDDQSARYALVISDIRMPGETGLSVLEDLRSRDWATPVILMTAFGSDAAHEESRRVGANVILDKPFELDHLIRIVKRVVPRDG
jgi:CheY-like chemotaxis protein